MSTLAEIDELLDSVKKETDIVKKVKLLTKTIHDNDLRIKDVAKKLEVKDSYVCHLLRLNRLPEMIIDGYYTKDVTLSHLFIISRLKNKEQIIEAYEKILGENLTIKKTEELVRDMLYGIKTKGEYIKREEKEAIAGKLKSMKKSIDFSVIQTRIKSKVILEIKGNLEYTSKTLRNLIDYLKVWQE